MKFLIAGLGSIGRRHLRNLLALGERDILLYRTYRSSLPDDDLAAFPVEKDLEAALAQRPQAVIVSNPTALHLDVAIPAAQAGCHLLLEKPISHSLDRVKELFTTIQSQQVQVLVGYQFRFHPGLQKVKQILVEGRVGKPLSFRAEFSEYLPGMHPWEDYRTSYSALHSLGGGVILTLCHPLDYLRWLLGEVKTVWAYVRQLSELSLDVEDTAEIGMEFENGAIGSVHLDYNRRPPAHHLEIVGTLGTLRWDNADGTVSIYRVDHTPSESKRDSQWEKFSPPVGFERNDMFLDEMRHFVSIVRENSEPQCTLNDGHQALRLVLAAHHSSREGVLVSMNSF